MAPQGTREENGSTLRLTPTGDSRMTLRTTALVVALLTLGFVLGRAQAPVAPDFEIRVNAPGGSTTIECVRGCALAWVERGVNPTATPIPTFNYSCGAQRCSSGLVGGW